MVQVRSLLLVLILLAGPCFAENPIVVFMTDFGVVDDSVAICKGVMLGIFPNLRIIDLTHEVKPYSIRDAARFLAGSTPYYPEGTIFVVVVDPGVGSSRKPVVVKSKRNQFFVLPDNGIITLVEQQDGIESVREITNKDWMIGSALSSTFHGRDIFSPVAAHLAKKEVWTAVGPEMKDHVRISSSVAALTADGTLSGEVIGTDGPFGNLITNIQADLFLKLNYKLGQVVHAKIGEKEFHLPFHKTFSDVPVQQPLFYVDSRGRLALAVNQGSFADTYHISPPLPIVIYRE